MDIFVVLCVDYVRCAQKVREIKRDSYMDVMCRGYVFSGGSEVQLYFFRLDVFGVLQFRCWIQNCSNFVHFEGQKFQEEEKDGCGEEGAVAGACCFGEKAPALVL